MIEKIVNYFGAEGLLDIIFYALAVCLVNVLLPLWLGIAVAFTIYFVREIVWDRWICGENFEWRDFVCFLIGIVIGIF